MSLYRNESLTTAIEAYGTVLVPDIIYVLVLLEIPGSNDRLYVQVKVPIKISSINSLQ